MIKLKRVYEEPAGSDGTRILVERLWPRGLTKDEAKIDEWAKEVSPSPELRKWYAHDVGKWPEFKRRYVAELKKNNDSVDDLRNIIKGKAVTFVYAAKDEQHNSAVVLKEFLEK